jgi:hypothetical protein
MARIALAVVKKLPRPSDLELDGLREAMETAELDFANAKLAYYHGSEYKGQSVGYDDLRGYADRFIAANYAFQKARWGTVKVRLTVSRLLRE